jgi:hypothetical protein
MFNAPRFWNKEYCSARCRRRFKNKRAAERDREKVIALAQTEDRRFADEINNPSVAQLDRFADAIRDEIITKPIKFIGTIPMWNPPDDISFVKQLGLPDDQNVWVMQLEDPIARAVRAQLGLKPS